MSSEWNTFIVATVTALASSAGAWRLLSVFTGKSLQKRVDAAKLELSTKYQKEIDEAKASHERELELVRQSFQKEFTKFESQVRKEEKIEEVVLKYTGSILLASKDLQDRLWHLINEQGKAGSPILLRDDAKDKPSGKWPMTKKHYLQGTVFFFCQYFCWLEILRHEIRFINFGKDELTNEFLRLIKVVERSLADTKYQRLSTDKLTEDFPLFQLMQTELGCALIKEQREALSCMTFNEFSDSYAELKFRLDGLSALEGLLIGAMDKSASNFANARIRIVNNSLVDLIKFLDQYNNLTNVEEIKAVPLTGIDLSNNKKLVSISFRNSSMT